MSGFLKKKTYEVNKFCWPFWHFPCHYYIFTKCARAVVPFFLLKHISLDKYILTHITLWLCMVDTLVKPWLPSYLLTSDHIFLYIYIYRYVCIDISIYRQTYLHTHAHTHTYTHIYIYLKIIYICIYKQSHQFLKTFC